MASASTKDIWFKDRVSKKTYRVVWMIDLAVLLESDDKAQVLTSIEILRTYYRPAEDLTSQPYPYSSPQDTL